MSGACLKGLLGYVYIQHTYIISQRSKSSKHIGLLNHVQGTPWKQQGALMEEVLWYIVWVTRPLESYRSYHHPNRIITHIHRFFSHSQHDSLRKRSHIAGRR